MPYSSIPASATRSSACICWNLLVILTPYPVGKMLHFRFETFTLAPEQEISESIQVVAAFYNENF